MRNDAGSRAWPVWARSTASTPRKWREPACSLECALTAKSHRKSLRMCSYKSLDLKSFGMNTYKNQGWGGGSFAVRDPPRRPWFQKRLPDGLPSGSTTATSIRCARSASRRPRPMAARAATPRRSRPWRTPAMNQSSTSSSAEKGKSALSKLLRTVCRCHSEKFLLPRRAPAMTRLRRASGVA